MMEKQRNKNILDAQYSLIIILTKGVITYINKTLFQHYNFKNLADFNSKHNSISELFEPYDTEALMPLMDGISWLNYVKGYNDKSVFAYITDKDSKLHIYDVHYRGKIASNQEIVVFTDVTQIQEQNS